MLTAKPPQRRKPRKFPILALIQNPYLRDKRSAIRQTSSPSSKLSHLSARYPAHYEYGTVGGWLCAAKTPQGCASKVVAVMTLLSANSLFLILLARASAESRLLCCGSVRFELVGGISNVTKLPPRLAAALDAIAKCASPTQRATAVTV